MHKFANVILLVIPLIGFACCSGDIKQEVSEQSRYFSIKHYFEKEASKFNGLHSIITKTVEKNGEGQKRTIAIKDWKKEFDFYILSDINKPDWKNSYQIDSSENSLLYKALDSALRTRYIQIEKDVHGDVKHILIFNRDVNALYKSSEMLNYFPDSLYEIYKIQQVKLLGTNSYRIKGVINP